MNRLLNIAIAASKRWWIVVLAFVLNFAAFTILFALEDQFEVFSGGMPTFDTQNNLTQPLIVEQLPLYQGEARTAYLRFAAFDFVFPLVAGVFLVIVFTLLLRVNTWAFAGRLLKWGLPFLPLVGTLADYGENISLLSILQFGTSPVLMDAALLFKRVKLTFLVLNGPLVMVLLALLIGNLVYRVVHARSNQLTAV